ncbi:Membrane protein MLC1 [Merluccius polli]|uniref:Membrane protein MLC1 n=1 Tax=Merluccius polli TaxID=89951 RepID=A0AA47MSH3_MERPO|nr:Membrane protein MLC1 [Merluccius polli]
MATPGSPEPPIIACSPLWIPPRHRHPATPPAVRTMQRDELSARRDPEFTYTHMAVMERGSMERGSGGMGMGGERGVVVVEQERPERDSYTVDVRASDLQLDEPRAPRHTCFSCRAWLYSVLIGGSLLIVSGFSLYLGNVFPVAMDYLRCAAGSGIPAAFASFAIAKNRHVAVADFQVVYVSTFAVTTTCLVWFGCKLVLSPSAVNINFNLVLMSLLEVLMACTVILSARSADDCCCHKKPARFDSALVFTPAVFPTRLLKAYSVIEVIVGISAVFGGIIALNMDALQPGPYLSVTFFWILVACFPSAIASHVVSEYPNKCLVEALIAISSVTSPLLFSASGFLSCSALSFVEIFLHDVPTAKQSYDILLLILMVLLLVQAVLTLATVGHCAVYKSQLRMGAPEWEERVMTRSPSRLSKQPSNGTLRDFDKDRAWNTADSRDGNRFGSGCRGDTEQRVSPSDGKKGNLILLRRITGPCFMYPVGKQQQSSLGAATPTGENRLEKADFT